MINKYESTYCNSALDFKVAAQKDGDPAATAYLDLDGVVYPLEPANNLSADVDTSDIELVHNLEWWHSGTVERIGRLPLDIVLSSSWGEAFMHKTVRSPRDVLNPTRALSWYKFCAMSKLAVIIHDIQIPEQPRPFAILDDEIDVEHAAYVLGEGIPYLLIRPNSMAGITHEQIDQLEEFIADMRSRSEA